MHLGHNGIKHPYTLQKFVTFWPLCVKHGAYNENVYVAPPYSLGSGVFWKWNILV